MPKVTKKRKIKKNPKASKSKNRILRLGLPKGSLQDATVKLFDKAGFKVHMGSRSYAPSIDDVEIEPMMLRAQEMARYVEQGVLDCGITGNDWVLENKAKVKRVRELVYAKQTRKPVRWVIAVPKNGKIRKLKDLKGARIATELVGVTKLFLSSRNISADVEFSWGATEGKIKAGLVDAIVELTETGQTLKANGLEIIETVCESTTQFVANTASYKDAWKRRKMDRITTLLMGAIEAEGKVGLKLNAPQSKLKGVMRALPAMKRPTVSKLWSNSKRDPWWAVETVLEESEITELLPKLKDAGAVDLIEYPLNKVIY